MITLHCKSTREGKLDLGNQNFDSQLELDKWLKKNKFEKRKQKNGVVYYVSSILEILAKHYVAK